MTPTERYLQCREQLSLANLKIHELEKEISAQEKALSHYTQAHEENREKIARYEKIFARYGQKDAGFSLHQELVALLEEAALSPK
jgi:hypothetical protein